MIYKEEFKIGLKDIGKQNKIKNRGILEIFENIGAYHSDIAGYGVNDTPVTKMAWILLDWKMQVLKRPTYGDRLKVNTWARGIKKFFTYRDFEIYNQDDELCVIATSKWALIDIENRKMQRLTSEIIEPYHPEEKHVFFEEELGKINILDNTEYTNHLKYQVIRKDIDVNKHMHNLYYLDLAYETLPEEIYKQRPFNNVRITYKKEIKLGDIVDCQYLKVKEKHIIVISSDEGKTMHAIIELE